jgi:hypothetical protein
MGDQMTNVEDFLEHFGVKGMHWGVRSTPGVHPRVNRMAANDAKEHARAIIESMFPDMLKHLTVIVKFKILLSMSLQQPKNDRVSIVKVGTRNVSEL